jgi:hypothetical protein
MHNTVKLRPGGYTAESQVMLPIAAGETRFIEGLGVTLHTTFSGAAFVATGAGSLSIKGLTFEAVIGGTSHSSNEGISCGEPLSSVVTRLEAEQLTFLGGSGHVNLTGCDASIREVRFVGDELSFVFFISQHATAMVDRCVFESLVPTIPAYSIYTVDVRDQVGVRLQITNSVFKNVRDIQVQQGAVDVQFSTFINLATPIDCTNDAKDAQHGKRIWARSSSRRSVAGDGGRSAIGGARRGTMTAGRYRFFFETAIRRA